MANLDHDEGLSDLSRLKAALLAAGDLAYEWDLASDRLSWQGDAAAFFGLAPEQLPRTGDAFHAKVNPEDLPTRIGLLSDHLVAGGVFDCEYRVRSESGAFNWVHERSAATLSSGGLPSRLVGLLRLVTARKEHEARLEYLANYDDLTGHYNKLRLRDALEHALAQALRYDHPSAFLMVGVDQLGMINSAYGSEVGDAVLVEIAQRLDRCLRNSDTIGRPGGDRFGIILSNSDLAGAKVTADRILAVFRDRPIEVGVHRLTVSVSIGVVAFPLQARTGVDVMSRAESAMLDAKAQGRDGRRAFQMNDAQQEDRRLAMAIGEEVKTALRENRLTLAYQPVVDANTHAIAYHECLVRMLDGDGNLIPATNFIPVVEQLGLMRTIDRHVLRLAIETLERQPESILAINISGVTAADHAWLRVFISHLKDRSDLAKRLIVEITETAALQDIDETARFVATIRSLGCKVALDDFGAGYTTFRHMKALTVDVVKIDGSFVRGIVSSMENQMFLRNLLSLAKILDLSIVAECVETLEDAQFLAREGVDLLQGYYFGKPDTALSPGDEVGQAPGSAARQRALA